MNLIHCLTGDVSCVGEARTYGRRCKRRIGRPRILAGYEVLYTLANLDPQTAAASSDLLKAIDLLLCYQHGGQRSEVADKWRDNLKEERRRMRKEGREPDEEHKKERKEGRRPGYETKQNREREDKRKQKEKERREKNEEGKRQEQEAKRRQQEEEKRRQREQENRRYEKERRQRQKQEKDRREQESQRAKEDTARKSRTQSWEGYLAQWKIIEAQASKVRFSNFQSI